MVGYINDLHISLGDDVKCKEYIISGGVKSFIDGYYLMSKLNAPGIYGQASGFLKYAVESIDELRAYTEAQIHGLALAKAYLRVK
jgi:isopentenyl-diphosphate delta-isomerase